MKKTRKWGWPRVLFCVLAFALLMLGLSALVLNGWSDLRTAAPEDAERAFAEALAEAGGGAPYMSISAAGETSVRRELESAEPASLKTLHLLAWDPKQAELLQVDFPFWFVRLKLSKSLNLGTLVSALARDWDNLDLRVTEDDLARRGPGLVLDHELSDGLRVLLWTE